MCASPVHRLRCAAAVSCGASGVHAKLCVQIKTLRKPSPIVHTVCACVAAVIGWDSAVHADDVAWSDCRDMFNEYVGAWRVGFGFMMGSDQLLTPTAPISATICRAWT